MTYLLDTDTCIGWLNRRHPALLYRLERTDPRQIALCSVVRAELLFGALKSARSAQNLDRLAGFFVRFPSLAFDDQAADAYSHIRAELEQRGTPIGSNDLMIAAIARSRDLILVTHNTAEFNRVPGLAVEDWLAEPTP